MKQINKIMVIITVLILSICVFCTVANAAPTNEAATNPQKNSSESTLSKNNKINLPSGTGTVVDVFTDESGKKFYTIQTPAGNTFYLVIDFNEMSENVYFLDSVSEKDLLALAGTGAIENESSKTDSTKTDINSTENQNTSETDSKNNIQTYITFGSVLVILVVGCILYFIKKHKTKNNYDSKNEYEVDDTEDFVSDNNTTEQDDLTWDDNE